METIYGYILSNSEFDMKIHTIFKTNSESNPWTAQINVPVQ